MSGYFITRAARQAGVGKDTLRFYEAQGLLRAPRRRESGYREYSPDDVERVKFIKRAQGLGFTLNEIKELIYLHDSGESDCSEICELTRQKICEVESKLAALHRLKDALERLVQACPQSAPVESCPIFQCLLGEETRERG